MAQGQADEAAPASLAELTARLRRATELGHQGVPHHWFDLVELPASADATAVDALLEVLRAGRGLDTGAACVRLLETLAGRAGEPWGRHRDEVCALLIERLLASGHVDAARPWLEALLAREPARDPERDPVGLDVMRQHGAWLLAMRRYAEATPLLRRVVSIQRSVAARASLRADLDRLGRALHFQGDRQGAYEAAAESLALARESLPADAPALLSAISNLGSALNALGDVRGAYELAREVLGVRERILPPDDPRLMHSLQSTSQLLNQLGDREEALALQQRALNVMEAAPERYGDMLLEGLNNVARLHHALANYDEAYSIGMRLLPLLEARRGEGDRDLGILRILLGVLERRRGQLEGSRALLEAAFAGLRRTLGLDHSFTQTAAAELTMTCRMQGDIERAAATVDLLLHAAIDALRKTVVAARPTAGLARVQAGVDNALSLCLAGVGPATEQRLLRGVVEASQQSRGAAIRVARRANWLRHHGTHPSAVAEELAAIGARVQAATAAGDAPELVRLTQRKDALEGAMLRNAQQAGHSEPPELPSITELAHALPQRSAAVAIVTFVRRTIDLTQTMAVAKQEWVTALVLLPDASVRLVDLGARSELLLQVDGLRAATHKKLRSTYLDPILALTGAAETLFMALDEDWQMVPWDALPLSSDAPVGSLVELRRVTSLLDLCAETTPLGNPSALLVGDVDYGEPSATSSEPLAASAPPIALLRDGAPAFPSLPGSGQEVDAVAALLREAFPAAAVTRLHGSLATKPAIAAAAPQATFLHFATHGFLPSAAAIARGAAQDRELHGVQLEFTPYALCGIALSGANRGPGQDGAASGLLTGEELQGWDLGRCFLAVLSACESGGGSWSQGQGLASMQASLHIAGARYVVATVAGVDDGAARLVTTEFYRRLLQDPEHPYRALWQARMAARERGVAFRDWAAFQMSGL